MLKCKNHFKTTFQLQLLRWCYNNDLQQQWANFSVTRPNKSNKIKLQAEVAALIR